MATQTKRLNWTGWAIARWRLGQRVRTWPALALLFAAIAALHLFSLTRWPPPYVDDAFVTSLAWGLIQTGLPYGPLQAGVMERYDGYWTLFSWAGTWLQSLPLRVLGLSLFAARLASLAFGMVLLAAIFAIGRRLGGTRLGVLAALLVALSSAFFSAAHMARPDIMVAAAGYGAIALYLSGRGSTSPAMGLVCGLLIGLGFEIHPNGAIYGPIIVVLYLIDHGRATLRRPAFWSFVAGAAIMLAAFVLVHVVPYPEAYLGLARLAWGDTKALPILAPGTWPASLRETLLAVVLPSLPRAPLVIAAVIVLLRERSAAAARLLVMAGLLLFQFFAILPYKPHYYIILLSPAADLLLAALLVRVLQAPRSGSALTSARTVLVWGLTGISVVLNLALIRTDALADYQQTVARIREEVPAGAVVMGEPKYWFGLSDHRFVSWQQLTYVRRDVPGSTLEDALRKFRPDVLIFDTPMEWHITDDPSRFPTWAQLLYLPKTELDGFLDRRARLVAAIDSETSGRVRVYRIDWD